MSSLTLLRWGLYSLQVEFDKSKHLSDASIRRRKLEREKLMTLERERDEKERAEEELREKEEEEKMFVIYSYFVPFFKAILGQFVAWSSKYFSRSLRPLHFQASKQ